MKALKIRLINTDLFVYIYNNRRYGIFYDIISAVSDIK